MRTQLISPTEQSGRPWPWAWNIIRARACLGKKILQNEFDDCSQTLGMTRLTADSTLQKSPSLGQIVSKWRNKRVHRQGRRSLCRHRPIGVKDRAYTVPLPRMTCPQTHPQAEERSVADQIVSGTDPAASLPDHRIVQCSAAIFSNPVENAFTNASISASVIGVERAAEPLSIITKPSWKR